MIVLCFGIEIKNIIQIVGEANIRPDGGVLTNQAIHLLDTLIYNFGNVLSFDVFADFNKKKLEAEDLILINFKHTNGLLSSFKATTKQIIIIVQQLMLLVIKEG